MEINRLTLGERRGNALYYFEPTTIRFCRGVNVFTGKGASILMNYVARSRESWRRPNESELDETEHDGQKMSIFPEKIRRHQSFLIDIAALRPFSDDCTFIYAPEIVRDPEEIREVALDIVRAAKRGVQIFVSTRDYFVLQEFNFHRVFPNEETGGVAFKFFSLYREDDDEYKIKIAEAGRVSELNPRCEITQAFDYIYFREINELAKIAKTDEASEVKK